MSNEANGGHEDSGFHGSYKLSIEAYERLNLAYLQSASKDSLSLAIREMQMASVAIPSISLAQYTAEELQRAAAPDMYKALTIGLAYFGAMGTTMGFAGPVLKNVDGEEFATASNEDLDLLFETFFTLAHKALAKAEGKGNADTKPDAV